MANHKLAVGEKGSYWNGVREFEAKTGAIVVTGTRPKKGPFQSSAGTAKVPE